jgi:putative peptidoglycan lipid II flippase
MGKPSEATFEIARKGSVITAVTMVSRPLGYLREAIQAYLFGASFLVDAFVISFNFPELLQTLFFSGATSAFLVPVCTRYMDRKEEYSLIYSTFFNICLILTLLLSLFLVLASRPLIGLMAPGFKEDAKEVAQRLFVIMIPLIPLHALLSVAKAFLNAKDHFLSPELSGIVWNLTFMACAIFLSSSIGIYSLALGASLGGLLQLLLQIPFLRRMGIQYRPYIALRHPSLEEAKGLFSGALIATGYIPLNSFIGRVIGSFLPEGEVASLSYAFRLFILPFSLFAVPVYTVVFTKVSRLYHVSNWKDIFSTIDGVLVLLSITLIPSSILLISSGDLFVRILYERGAFSERDTLLTYRALVGYSMGLAFYGLSTSFVRIFNGLHDTRTPAFVGLSSIGLNVVLCMLLMGPLRNLGIALASSLVSLYNFSILFFLLKKRTEYRMGRRARIEVIKALASGIVLCLCLFLVKHLSLSLYMKAAVCLLLTVSVCLLFFWDYYRGLLRRG